jgi:hypothetical protein
MSAMNEIRFDRLEEKVDKMGLQGRQGFKIGL